MRILKIITLCLVAATLISAQDRTVVYTNGVPRTVPLLPNSEFTNGSGLPSGACVSGSIYVNSDNGALFTCLSGAWTLAIPIISASFEDLDRKSDLGPAVLFSIPTGEGGSYLAKCYETQISPAGSYSLPQPVFTFTDQDSASTRFLEAPSMAIGMDAASYTVMLQATEGTDIEVSTSNYFSSPANTMHYAIHCKTTYLGQ